MEKQDKLLDKVALKTNVSKQDILSLSSDLQSKDLQDEKNVKDFILKVSKLAGKQVNPQQMDKLVKIIQNNQIPSDIEKLV